MKPARSVCLAMVATLAALGCARGDGPMIGVDDAGTGRDVTPVDTASNDTPTTDDTPASDDVPVSPDAPIADDVPTSPDVPVTPDVPASPDVPITPDVPTSPDVPVSPDVAPPEDLGPTCGPDQIVCGGTCVTTASDSNHCGRCGNACALGTLCTRGSCVSVCADGQTACPAAGGTVRCVNLQSDGANCGACATACPAGQTCSAGRCATTCPTGQTLCAGGSCASLTSDSANCGACGRVCAMGQRCSSGACACPAGQTLCNGTCVTTSSDNGNCGACGRACGLGQTCVASTCTCPTGQSLCSGTCINTATSTSNCGRCGNACVPGQSCVSGLCQCPTGQTLCGGRCVTTATDEANCGACGVTCPSPQTCTSGRCTCLTGQTLCGGSCANLQTDNANCGACGTTCPSGSTCASGRCSTACSAGLTSCGATCVNLQTSATNCGACGTACATGTTCRAGACVPLNDDRTSATALTLTAGELTVNGTTAGATFDGSTVCFPTSSTSPNVWYRFTLTQREIVYADTAGSSYDTRLYFAYDTGTVMSATCNDDAACSTGGFTSTTQSRIATDLWPGTYYVVVSGFGPSSRGAFTLHLQHIPVGYGSFFYSTALTGSGDAPGASTTTRLVGTSARTPTCGGGLGPSGEDMRWFMTCGGTTASLFSVCPGDGGTWVRQSGSTQYDPVMYVYSGQTGTQVQCNDDGTGFMCAGTGGDTSNFGSRISAPMPRGLNAVVVDERNNTSGLSYRLHYQIN